MHWCCITGQLYEEQISIGVFAVAQACSEPDLQSSTEQWGSYFALTIAAVHWYCITGQLYEEQISIGVFAVAQAGSTSLFGPLLALDVPVTNQEKKRQISNIFKHTAVQGQAPVSPAKQLSSDTVSLSQVGRDHPSEIAMIDRSFACKFAASLACLWQGSLRM